MELIFVVGVAVGAPLFFWFTMRDMRKRHRETMAELDRAVVRCEREAARAADLAAEVRYRARPKQEVSPTGRLRAPFEAARHRAPEKLWARPSEESSFQPPSAQSSLVNVDYSSLEQRVTANMKNVPGNPYEAFASGGGGDFAGAGASGSWSSPESAPAAEPSPAPEPSRCDASPSVYAAASPSYDGGGSSSSCDGGSSSSSSDSSSSSSSSSGSD